MGERKTFTLTDNEYKALIAEMQPTPLMYLSGGTPMFEDPQSRTNRAWETLGKKRGFKGMTVQPGQNDREFTAETEET